LNKTSLKPKTILVSHIQLIQRNIFHSFLRSL